jgi:hypothetical protein
MATRFILLCFVLPALTQVALSASPATATRKPAVSCESLSGKSFYNVAITGATRVAAAYPVPGYCRVTGTENGTQHDIEIRLPDEWHERYVQRGGGGFDGSIPPVGARNIALSAGAVQGANNGGHRDPTGAVLLNNPRAVERYAHGAILTATRFGKAVTQAYYGRPTRYAYYEGCSNGGRGAFNAAAKYGTEFNGIVAAAPTLNLTGQIAEWTHAAALHMPSREQFAQIHAAALAKCDAADGLKDGILSNWQGCAFDPLHDIPADVGLTAEQMMAVQTLLQDLKAPDGRVLYSAYGLGDLGLGAPAFGLFGVGQMRNIVFNDPNWSPATFDPTTSLPQISAVIDTQYQFTASIGGLIQFMHGGGKIIVWHGADDGLLSHRDTIRTWQQVADAAGSETMRTNSRLYIAPGVNHCAGGDGADTIDMLTPMMKWVEQGEAPATLTASKLDAKTGATRFTRPLCLYPGYPRYTGSGDVNDARSFECAVP